MTQAKYPRIGATRPEHRGICAICGAKASRRIDVQWTVFRGDDDSFRVCKTHERADVAELYAAKGAK